MADTRPTTATTTPLRIVVLAGLALLAGFVGAPPAAATPAGVGHAKIAGSSPEDGSTVTQAPDGVTLFIDAKPATVDGDPLQVYGPDGQRIDDGHTSVSDDGRELTVGLLPTAARPAGRYEIVYRIVSADTHLIAGRLEFTAQAAAPAVAALGSAARPAGPDGASATDGGSGRLRHGWSDGTWPGFAAAGAAGLAAVCITWRRRRRRRRAELAEAAEPFWLERDLAVRRPTRRDTSDWSGRPRRPTGSVRPRPGGVGQPAPPPAGYGGHRRPELVVPLQGGPQRRVLRNGHDHGR